MGTQTTPILGLNLEVIMGPALIGVFASSTFYLLTCQLAYKYFTRFPEDAWYFKLSVAIDDRYCSSHLRHMDCLPFSRPSLRATGNSAYDSENVTDHVGAELSDHSKKAILLFTLIIIRTAFATALTVKGFSIPSFPKVHEYEWCVIGTLSLDITLDVTLCGMLSYLLLIKRTQNRSSRTDPIVYRIVQYVFGTGALSCACAIIILICVLALPNNLIYLAPLILLEKFYVLSYLVLINSRHLLRRLGGKLQDEDMGFRQSIALTVPADVMNGVHGH
ncbi:hypothetical protein BD410DRAFT_902636 [Rickenella mellea]|uniref:DUF6534 domain-containing protein n=1 Tax=Rickenella mellea TaxID=50990 RepID=A0A4Y7PJC6_9AGAM|nr:hypothetical protein BD410DRAFT_902636 [Rickenella mellea]